MPFRTLFFIITFCLFCHNSVEARLRIDTLRTVTDTSSGVNKADAFVALAEYYFQNFYGLKTVEIGMKYFTEALTISWNSNDIDRVLRILNRLSVIYYSMGDFAKSLKISQATLFLSRKFHFVNNEILTLNQIALSYDFLNRPDSAEIYFRQVHVLGKKHKQYLSVAMSLIGHGELILQKGNTDSTYIYFMQAVTYLKKDIRQNGVDFNEFFLKKTQNKSYNRLWNVAMTYITIADFFVKIKQPQKALQYSDTALALSDITQNIYLKSLVVGQKVVIWTELHNSDSLIKYLKLTSVYKDSLFENASAFQKILMNTLEFSREKKLKLIEQEGQIKDLKLQTIRIIVIGMVVLSLVFTIVSILLIRQQKMKRIKEKMQLERQALQLQMNPHFISNALIAIQSYIFTGDKLQAGKLLADFSEMMRLILKNSREEFVVLEQELKLLRHYLELQQLRYSDMFSWKFNVKGSLVPEQILIPPMIMQPFIENAIEHGVVPKGKGHIIISIEIKENVILFQVEDNGVGRNKTHPVHYSNESRSHSTDITIDRLHVLMEKQSVFQFVVHDLLDSLNNPIGTKVSLNIPFKTI